MPAKQQRRDQLLGDPLVVGAVAEPLADEDADHPFTVPERAPPGRGAPAPSSARNRLKVGTCSATATRS